MSGTRQLAPRPGMHHLEYRLINGAIQLPQPQWCERAADP